MRDIRSLYMDAKGHPDRVAAYDEAVHYLLENDPYHYILQLEYIISSASGLSTFPVFMEKYGLPIVSYDYVTTCFEKCRDKCDSLSYDGSGYTAILTELAAQKQKYQQCFAMFEYYCDSLPEGYVKTYYSTTKGKLNSRLPAGMIGRFGEAAVPDMILVATQMGDKSTDKLFEYLYVNDDLFQPVFYEWVHGAVDSYCHSENREKLMDAFSEYSASTITNAAVARNKTIFTEALIMDNESAVCEYTEDEVAAIQDLISFKEYSILWTEDTDQINRTQKEIYSLYEELESLEEDVADSVIPMKPGAFAEAPWVVNTRDKKTGSAPTYIARNHDMSKYGEEDDDEKKKKKDEDDEPTLDDYKRPSAEKEPVEDDLTVTGDDEEDDTLSKKPVPASGVNNYYYYTYNNSLNKNQGSFNRTTTNRDDHSTHDNSTHDDHSNHRNWTDRSTGKMTNSNNKYGDNDHQEESAFPWELSINDIVNGVIMEDVGDADNDKPTSDHPIKDALTDMDRAIMKRRAEAKRRRDNTKMAVRAALKPVNRAKDWVINTVNQWKDMDETRTKEKLADPHARKNLFTAIKYAIAGGSLAKAGILFNPIFLFLGATRFIGKDKREFRIRNEMIGEIKTEIKIVEAKIEDAGYNHDLKEKYQLMRFKNELNKKLMRVAGDDRWSKIL